jgi:hypothetical protein
MTVADFGWGGKVRLPELWDLVTTPDARVTFGKVVRAHDLHRTHPVVADEATAVGRALRARFEEQHGTIQNSYFCEYLLGGCAMVERATGAGRHARIERRLHSVLNSPVADLVALEARCMTLSDDVNAALHRPGNQAALRSVSDAVYSAMTRVLGAADRFADPAATADDRLTALTAARREVADAATRVGATIQRQARFVYFQGTLIGAAVTIALCAGIGALAAHHWERVLSPAALTATTVFGALGAVVSVFQRIASGKLVLDYHASRFQLIQLGMLRPAVGATFGAVVQFALVGGLLGATDSGQAPDRTFGLFALIGFISGFSERFATDMIERAGQVISGTTTEPTPPSADQPAAPATTSANGASPQPAGTPAAAQTPTSPPEPEPTSPVATDSAPHGPDRV